MTSSEKICNFLNALLAKDKRTTTNIVYTPFHPGRLNKELNIQRGFDACPIDLINAILHNVFDEKEILVELEENSEFIRSFNVEKLEQKDIELISEPSQYILNAAFKEWQNGARSVPASVTDEKQYFLDNWKEKKYMAKIVEKLIKLSNKISA
jgi:hypothetical protein